jgi:hypothetical protein
MVFAQEQPAPAASGAAQAAEKSGAEWSTLISGMEQRVARLLPCDPGVRSAIEEVSRASDARIAALTAYWQEAAKRSKEQADLTGKLIADNDARLAVWRVDRADSEQEQMRLRSQISALHESSEQKPALSPASPLLDGIAQNSQTVAKRSADRDDMAARWSTGLNDFAKAAQARQAAIDGELKALTTESGRWTAYFAARIARAQMECSLTGPAEADPAPRPRGTKGK